MTINSKELRELLKLIDEVAKKARKAETLEEKQVLLAKLREIDHKVVLENEKAIEEQNTDYSAQLDIVSVKLTSQINRLLRNMRRVQNKEIENNTDEVVETPISKEENTVVEEDPKVSKISAAVRDAYLIGISATTYEEKERVLSKLKGMRKFIDEKNTAKNGLTGNLKQIAKEFDAYIQELEEDMHDFEVTTKKEELNEIEIAVKEASYIAIHSKDLEEKERVLTRLKGMKNFLEDNRSTLINFDCEAKLNQVTKELDKQIKKLENNIDRFNRPSILSNLFKQKELNLGTIKRDVSVRVSDLSKSRLTYVSDWFKKHAKSEITLENDTQNNKGTTLKRVGIAAGVILLAGTIGTAGYAISKAANDKKEQEVEVFTEDWSDIIAKNQNTLKETTEKITSVKQAETKVVEVSKEDQILEMVSALVKELNQYEGLNVTEEQVLALFLHLNVGNSYMNEEDTLALDKLTRESLIKQYFVGLTPDSEEFEEYKITDDDLAKVSTCVMELRNAFVNRVIVLNDEGNYVESKKIIGTIASFVTEKKLQDEAETLITSVQSMQTKDSKILKEEVYRYYNYIFAGPKSNVRNFDDYGFYQNDESKEMTFENQGMTIRFLTWFLDTFVDINISGKNLIPQDIINSKEAKLMDQSNLLRALGYKNCTAFGTYYGINFDEPIDNKKSTSSNRSSKKQTTTTTTTMTPNISNATGDAQLDQEIHEHLQQDTTINSTFTTSNGSTVAIVESGPSSTTIVVQPDPSTATVTDTPPTNSGTTTVIEGGGNEHTEAIDFGDTTYKEEIIDQGGEVIQRNDVTEEYIESTTPATTSLEPTMTEPATTSIESTSTEVTNPTETIEEIHFEEDVQEVETEPQENSLEASIRDEINALCNLRDYVIENYSLEYTEEPYQKTLSC